MAKAFPLTAATLACRPLTLVGTGSRVDPAVVDVDWDAEDVTVGPRHTCTLGGERAWCWGDGTGAYVRGPDDDHPGGPGNGTFGRNPMMPEPPDYVEGEDACAR